MSHEDAVMIAAAILYASPAEGVKQFTAQECVEQAQKLWCLAGGVTWPEQPAEAKAGRP